MTSFFPGLAGKNVAAKLTIEDNPLNPPIIDELIRVKITSYLVDADYESIRYNAIK